MPASAGRMRARANHASDSRIARRAGLGAAIRSGIVDWAGSALTGHCSRNPDDSARDRLGQRLLERGEILEALGHRDRAADHVLHGGHRLGVVLAVPRLLVGADDLTLLVLLAQELQIDPAVVGLDDLRVVVHLRIRVVEAGDQAPLPLYVPVALQISAEEARELPRVVED